MGEVLVLIVALASSASAYFCSRRWTVADSRGLRLAVVTMLECVGAATMFLAINIALGIGLILMIRSITPLFVSLYVLAPLLLIIVSMIQGIVFCLWWR